jgi:hypothetical protein
MLRSLLAHRKLIIVGALCALAGSAAGIAVTSAATKNNNAPHRHVFRFFAPFGPRIGGLPGKLGPLGIGGAPVHGDFVVPNSAGNAFQTVTFDRGKFQSLAGNQLTIKEGTHTTPYKTVTLTIPSNATIDRDGQTAKLTDLKPGDEVNVVQTPSGTHVNAISQSFKNQFKQRFGPLREFRGRLNGAVPVPPGGPPVQAPPGAPYQ